MTDDLTYRPLRESGWRPIPLGADYARFWRAANGEDSTRPKMWQRGPVRALVGREMWRDGTTRWHISVSCEDRVPSWEELVQAAHDVRPGVAFTMGVPPRTWWMNAHPHVLHLWESRDEGLIDEWRQNAQGHKPS
jgi:hypothetical protein